MFPELSLSCPLHVLNVLVNLKYSFDVILRSKRIVELRRTIDHLKIHADTKTGPSWCSSASADYYHNYLIFSYGSDLWKRLGIVRLRETDSLFLS